MTLAANDNAKSGLVAGGRGGPEDQLVEDGQEEVFAREEVESGRIEHHVETGGGATQVKPAPVAPAPTPPSQDEEAG